MLFYTKNQILDNDEFQKFTSFIYQLIKKQSLKKLRIVFRGENLTSLYKKLNVEENNIQKFNDLLFLIGDKGRIYQSDYFNEIKNKNKIFKISDVSTEIFDYIFYKLNKLFKSKAKNSELKSFQEENKKFSIYFLDKNNKNNFVQLISQLGEFEKLQIRDYYLTLLHKCGNAGLFNNTFFISTTTNYKVSRSFTGSQKGVILISWISLKIRKYENPKKIIRKYKLPLYKKILYANQHEVSLKGGIFPHFLIGYLDLLNNKFHINSNFFNEQRSIIEIINKGFYIDQSEFEENLELTNYVNYVQLDYDNNFIDSI